MEQETLYDTIIIGAGPAGLTAAIYCARRALKTLVLSSDVGGQVVKTADIENYPGHDRITGVELATRFRQQAEKFGSTVLIEEAKKINQAGGLFMVETSNNQYQAKSLILAFGKKPRQLDVPGEEQFRGRGVTYCATCDAPFFKKKTVAVVGGGNSALDAAVLASKICEKVYIIHRGDKFSGEQYLIQQLSEAPNVEIIFGNNVKEIRGSSVVESVILDDGQELAVAGVMVEIGFVVDRSLVEGIVEIDPKNQIIVNEHQQTSVPGIFAAGDLTPTPYKQIVISAGEGAKAALSVFDYLQRLAGKRGVFADWH